MPLYFILLQTTKDSVGADSQTPACYPIKENTLVLLQVITNPPNLYYDIFFSTTLH